MLCAVFSMLKAALSSTTGETVEY